ncbi:MAG: bifunctional UDP-3-O-[3-hydroxymyristoyl] N-acetylglucosamine deacetylase/3-hydroxyacyl-ACP dehydratase [Verrucomicrobiales bacterium]|jgi:UDP-3-O-[3-hydroxymyristoyl] N-acetylglucosamine deacetylase/3-hydroxyacyl-[acyl-carrier-protein] dehydratase|nr:bifunctional UDP-3-O-[3-hydroxymyristoyl] N-acetylglucosamine deacetylase/3-hydroxyacyl-ACP dehydratase [Verrucomicrobiales bacterium]
MPVINQTTIEHEASLVGTSLHTGNKVNLTIKPADAGTGYVFKRMDLPDAPAIGAGVELVRQVERSTTISEGAVKIHTIEHLLSALRGLGIDNVLIEMDSNEPPIGDGSADLFVQLIAQAGRKELAATRTYFELREPVYVYGKDDSYMVALPHDSFKVTCTNANHTGLHTQYFSYTLAADTYAAEISKARTFVFYEEVRPLLEKGLIKGGSLENAVVIKGESLLSKEAMRYPDEFVRHKILDIIGDLALFPVHLKAHIIAAKPSHGLNVELTKAIAKEYKRYLSQLMPVEYIPVGEGALDTREVMRILPHRFPFLMVDRILKFEGETRATGCKNITINEPYFQGHFPNHPVMPGVLQIEAMAQVASILMLRRAENVGRIGFFMSADKVKFRKPVMPGDTLIIQAELTKSRGKIGKAVGQCTVNGEVVSECELSFVVQ